MLTQIGALVDEVNALRESNAQLRQELREAVQLFEKGSQALGGVPRGERRREPVNGRRRGRPRKVKGPKGRATPPEVTTEVVRAALAKLGTATAGEIAREITKAGASVSGRAIRFLAEGAGARTFVGNDGKRRYTL